MSVNIMVHPHGGNIETQMDGYAVNSQSLPFAVVRIYPTPSHDSYVTIYIDGPNQADAIIKALQSAKDWFAAGKPANQETRRFSSEVPADTTPQAVTEEQAEPGNGVEPIPYAVDDRPF